MGPLPATKDIGSPVSTYRREFHYAAAIAVCERAGCLVTDLAGDALHTGRGLLVSADAATHEAVLEIVAPHLAEVLRAS